MPTVSYDSRALTIDGKRRLILSGSIHYSRCEPDEWAGLFKGLRDANCDTVETYVNWHLHEPVQGHYDFKGRLDLRRFLKEAADAGLYVILRVGPYICGEQNLGGIPSWVLSVEGMVIRTSNAPWQELSERWIRYLWDQVSDFSAGEGGPIIMVQVENEFANISESYGEEGVRYIAWCGELGKSLNCGVPLIMCLGGTPGVLETINAWRPHEHLEHHWKINPEQPAICTEHWSGWYNLWGFPRHLRPTAEFAYAALRFIAGGATGMNYFLWHGGNNIGRECMYLQTPDYDFDAPIDHWNRKTQKYHHLAAMHATLREVESVMLDAPRPSIPRAGETSPVFKYGEGANEVTFLCNDHPTEATTRNYDGISYALPPLSVIVLRGGQLLFATHELPSLVAKPKFESIHSAFNWEFAEDAVPSDWPKYAQSSISVTTPEQQLPHTLDQTDYCWYETTLEVSPDEAGKRELVLTRAADFIHVFVDGILCQSGPLPLVEERGNPQSDHFKVSMPLDLRSGRRHIAILCTALGLIKGDWMLGKCNMIEERKGLWGPVLWNSRTLSGSWQIQAGLLGERLGLPQGANPMGGWKPVAQMNALHKTVRWFRTEFAHCSKNNTPIALTLTGMSKGFAWLNGQPLTRFWLLDAATAKTPEIFLNWIVDDSRPGPTQHQYRIPSWMLRQHNELILVDELGGTPEQVCIEEVS